MKILVYSWRDPEHPFAGGAEQVMHEHMKGWIDAGHEVTLFSSKINNLPEKTQLDGVKIIRKGYQYLGVQLSGFLFWLKNRQSFDFVVDQFHGIPFFTPLFVRKPKLAVLQEVAREVWLKNPLRWPLNWIVGWLGYLGEFFVFLIYRKTPFMVGSNSAMSDLSEKMKIPAKNITVVPHGVIVNKLKTLPKKESTPTIMFLGALTRDKGVEDAIKTFSILAKKGKYQFWVVGKEESKEYLNKIKRLTNKLNIEVKFWGFVSGKKKFELLAKSHLMLNPSLREGWGLVNIEANAMGTPVISYFSPGLVDSIVNDKTGIIVKENNPSELASEVTKLLADTKKYILLSKNAIKWSNRFDWKSSRTMSLKLVDKVASSTYSF